jgi:AmiR/NasT family two-component response regulator
MNGPATGLRVAVADDERDMRQFFQELLPVMGHQVVAVAETGRQLADYCRNLPLDIVVTDIKMPDMDGFEAAAAINSEREVPFVLVSAYAEGEFLARSDADYIMSYLVKPVKPADLQAALTLAVARFEQYQRVRSEAANLRQSLEDRKTIEQSKGIVMHRLRIGETEAYQRMRRLSSNHNWKLIDVAHKLLEAEKMFKALEEVR